VSQLRHAATRLAQLDVQPLVVTFESESATVEYAKETELPWPLLIDPDRHLYRAYGMGRARLRHLWGLGTMRAYWREARQGRFPRIPRADVVQQGGNVLIDPGGIVRFHHIGRGPADRPSVRVILAARSGLPQNNRF